MLDDVNGCCGGPVDAWSVASSEADTARTQRWMRALMLHVLDDQDHGKANRKIIQGWVDLVALRYATRLNRLSALAITKLDVLSGLDRLRVAVRYRGREGAGGVFRPRAFGHERSVPGAYGSNRSERLPEPRFPGTIRTTHA